MIPIYTPDLGNSEIENVTKCVTTGWISSQGDYIPMFERDFSKWNKVHFGIVTSSCTTALHLAFVALGITVGDEVICPDLTFIAPANMIRLTGATPILVDVEETSWGIDPQKIKDRITDKTKAILVVHAFGHPADMDPIMAIAKKHDLFVIEDVAEAPGAYYKGTMVGSIGDLSCYSFFANKIMTTGEGGIVLTNDPNLDKKMRILRDHGMSRERRYVHTVSGFNYRMTNMQAAVGVAQLEKLTKTLKLRTKQEIRYKTLFNNNPKASWRPTADWCTPVHWMSTITLQSEELRDPLLGYMQSQGVDCRQMIYPVHLAEPFKNDNDPANFPVSRSISLCSLHLPSSNSLTMDKQKMIADSVQNWLEKNG
jgi:perosamine synthetase